MTRHTVPSDRAEVLRMRRSLFPVSGDADLDDLSRYAESEFVVLVFDRANGSLGGLADVGSRKYAEGCSTSPVACLEGIWVDPDIRRTGVASDLLHHAESWARNRGFQELASDSLLENTESEAFHLATGFTEVERIVCYRRELKE